MIAVTTRDEALPDHDGSGGDRPVLVVGRSLLCGLGVGAASAAAAVAVLLPGAGADHVVGLGSLAVLIGVAAGFVVQLLNAPVFLAAVRHRRHGSVRWWGAAFPLVAAAVLPLLLLGDADTATSSVSAAAALLVAAVLVRPCARWCARPLVVAPA